MKTLSNLRVEIKQARTYLGRYKNVERLTTGSLIDAYLWLHGIRGLYTSKRFDTQYEVALKNFFNDKATTKKLEGRVLKALEFVIWIKTQQEVLRLSIKGDEHTLKEALEYPKFINHVMGSTTLDMKYKLRILAILYCSMQEIFKNVVSEDFLIQVYRQIKGKDKDREYITLGPFLEILRRFEENERTLSELFEGDFRNSILHARYTVGTKSIVYYKKTTRFRKSEKALFDETKNLAIVLQFFVLFYLRVFGPER